MSSTARVAESLARAIEEHQAGRCDAAEVGYRQILETEPLHGDALHLLGMLCTQTGRHQEAIEYVTRALAVNPEWAEARFSLGNAWRGLRKLDEAVGCYRRALDLNPNYVEALVNLGNSWKDLKKLDDAVGCYQRALELRPDLALVHSNLGNVLQDQGELDKAVACYTRALELQPDFADAHTNLGKALHAQGKLDDAVASCRRALELKPDFPAALNNLGNALQERGDFDEAIACYQEALRLQPGFAAGHSNLGIAYSSLGALKDATSSYRRALELDPDYPEAHYNLGNACLKLGDLDDAVASYRRALELRRNYADVYNGLGSALKDQGSLDEALACFRRALELEPGYVFSHSNLLYTLHYCPGVTPDQLATEHAAYDRQHAAPLLPAGAPRALLHHRHQRLKVGFVSPDLGRHPVGYFLVRVLENLSPDRLETTFYSHRRGKDDLTGRLQAAASGWRDVAGLSDEKLADQIREDQIDILFDLSGHTGYNRLLVFARKPAPIQITWIGYEGTTGLAAMDFLLADRHVVPEGSECFYRERVLRMPDGYLCFDPPKSAPPVGPLPALQTGTMTFGSFNNLAKTTPDVVAVWADILRRVPGSRLLMKYRGLGNQNVRQRYIDLFAARGVDPQRLIFLPFSSHAEYLATYQHVDLVLDTFPFSGSTVTCNSLWMGVPVLTCPGATFASRHSLSHLSNVGLTGMIARDLREYVEKAVSCAADLPKLAALRSDLREQMAASPLCDGKRFADHWTSLLYDVWENGRQS